MMFLFAWMLVSSLFTSVIWLFIMRGRVSAAYCTGHSDSLRANDSLKYILGFNAGRKFQRLGYADIL